MKINAQESAGRSSAPLESEQVQGGARSARWVQCLRLWLLALWLGSALFFSAAVAPAAFKVLRDARLAAADELAGAIVSRTLSIVNTSGFVIGLLLLLSALWWRRLVTRRALALEVLLLGLLLAVCGVGRWVLATRMQNLRAQAGRPLAELALDDPLRVAFSSLHGYSVTILSVGLLAALAACVLIARRTQRAVAA